MAALRPVLALFGLSEQNVKLPVPSCVSSGPLTVTRKSGPWLVRALRGDLSSLGKRGLADGTCSRSRTTRCPQQHGSRAHECPDNRHDAGVT